MATISIRFMRPTRHWGGSLGVTKWEYVRIVSGRVVLFEITHDGVTRTATVRSYPGGGYTTPTHNFEVHNVTARDIGAAIANCP